MQALNNQKFDVIVSNPPYIEQNDAHLKQGDLRFEPASALASGLDGLDDIKRIISARSTPSKPAWMAVAGAWLQSSRKRLQYCLKMQDLLKLKQ